MNAIESPLRSLSKQPLHPLVKGMLWACYLLVPLVIVLREHPIESQDARNILSGIAAWGALAVSMGAAVVLMASQVFKRWGALHNESSTLSLIGVMLVGFFMLVMAFSVHNAARMDQRMDASLVDGQLVIAGAIGGRLPEIVTVAANQKAVRSVLLKDNDGGDIIAAIMAAQILEEAGVTKVRVDGNCASSCAYLAMMLPDREFGPTARMGFHDVRSMIGSRNHVDIERAFLKTALMKQGHSSKLIDKWLSTDDVVWYTPEQLSEMGAL